jgi:hypothetical protein
MGSFNHLVNASFAAILVALTASPISAEPAPDYAEDINWLCKPGRVDACELDLSATAILPDGTHSLVTFNRAKDDKKIDCFYVYPTVSLQDAESSNLAQESAQFSRIRSQFSRYSNSCRLVAPMYRQVTLKLMAEYATDLKAFNPNEVMAAAPQYKLAYGDVSAAWKYYLEHENQGRGVILVGHSQGSFLLRDLIKNEIDGKDIQKKFVSAHLGGVVVATSKTDASLNEFKNVPVCESGSQTGCYISYSSFDASAPPPDWSQAFGMSKTKGTVNNCSNPAELSGDDGKLIPFIDASRISDDGKGLMQWTQSQQALPTPFLTLPDFYKAKCVERSDGAGYLAVDFTNDVSAHDQRNRIMPGHVIVGPVLLSNWGIHDADMELFMGNLIKIAASQAASWK